MNPLQKVNECLWELPVSYKAGMRVPGRIYATEKMLANIAGDNRGVVMMAQGRSNALEEAPWAYKDVENVVDVCHNAGIARKVARLRPIGVVKG